MVMEPGGRASRVLIGFGTGRGEANSLVEAFEMIAEGTQALASAQAPPVGGCSPGLLVPLGLAGAVGSVATSAAVTGNSNVLRELGPESMNAAARRTTDGVAVFIIDFYTKRGGSRTTVRGRQWREVTNLGAERLTGPGAPMRQSRNERRSHGRY